MPARRIIAIIFDTLMRLGSIALFLLCALSALAQPRLVLPIGHTAPLNQVQFTTDGKFILTGSKDGALMLWEASTGKLVIEYQQHGDLVNSIRFNNSGSKFISGANDNTARIWETSTGKLLHTLADHKGGVVSAQFSPDEKYIMTASDQTIRIWDAANFQLIDQFGAHSSSIVDAFYSPDGKKIFSGSWDKTARIWDADSRLLLHELKAHTQWLSSIATSRSGKFLVTASLDSTAILWNTETGSMLHRFTGHKDDVVFAAFSPNDSLIVTASGDNTAIIWDVFTGKIITSLTGHAKDVVHATFSPDSKTIITVSKDQTGKLWSTLNGKLISTLQKHINELNAAAFSPDGRSVVTVSSDWTGMVWEAASGLPTQHLRGFSESVRRARYAPDGRSILTVSAYDVNIWNTSDGILKTGLRQNEPVLFAELSADGKKMMTASRQHIYVWDVERQTVIKKIKTSRIPRSFSFSPDGKHYSLHHGEALELYNVEGETKPTLIMIPDPLGRPVPISSGKFSPDGKKFVVASWDGIARLFDTETGKFTSELRGHQRELLDAIFSPDGKYVYTHSIDGSGKLWDLSTGRIVTTLMHFYTSASAVFEYGGERLIFSPDGNHLALIQYTSVWVYNMRSGERVSEMTGHTAEIVSAAFSPDGKKLLTAAKDNTAKIWDVLNGSRLANLKGHNGMINSASFSPDGSKVITGSNDNTSKVWNIKGDLVYSFFATDNDGYFLQLPSMHYLATRGAAKLLHYVTPELNTISFQQLDVKYNRPDKVLTGIGQSDTALISSYKKAYEKRIRKLGIDTTQLVSDLNLPEVEISNLSFTGYETSQGTMKVRIRAKDAKAKLSQLYVWVNDVPLFGMKGIQFGKRNLRSLDTTIVINLSKGENHITSSVMNSSGIESYRMPLFVKYKAETGSDKVYFAGIGMNEFAERGHDLDWSVKDIQDLATKLKEIYGDRLIVDTLFNKNVTKKNIAALKNKLQSSTINDKVIVCYSGHGLLSKDFDYYLSTYQVDFTHPEKEGLPYEALESLLDGIASRQKLLLIDACHSGEIDKEEISKYNLVESSLSDSGTKSGRKPVLKDGKMGMQNSFDLMQQLFVNVGKSTGATVISAAGGMQFAQEQADLKNGVFTYSILEYMKSHPSATVTQLKNYINKRVPELTAGMQVPTTRTETLAVDWKVW